MQVCREAFLKQAAVKKINCGTCFFPSEARKEKQGKQTKSEANKYISRMLAYFIDL
jgi:hypothetical protein